MGETAAMSETIRCPFCLFEMSKPGAGASNQAFECVGCNRAFELKDALTGTTGEYKPAPAEASEDNSDKSSAPLWWTTIILSAAGSGAAYHTCGEIKGPNFLLLYAGLGFVVFVLQLLVRHMWDNRFSVSVMALVIYWSVGFTRYLVGYHLHEMRKWDYLFILMVVGAIAQFLRASMFEGVGTGSGSDCSSGGFWSSGCSSGCGSSCGGGCGGGGCGGCGS